MGAEAEAPILWPPDAKNWLILNKTLMLGKTEGGRRRGDRVWVGWMAARTQWTWIWLSPRVGDGQGSLACCSPRGCKESDMTDQLNWTVLNLFPIISFTNIFSHFVDWVFVCWWFPLSCKTFLNFCFYFNLYIFSWRIIALQYCVDFCHLSSLIIHKCMYTPYLWATLPPPTPLQLNWSPLFIFGFASLL